MTRPKIRLRLCPWPTVPDGVASPGWVDWQPIDAYSYLAVRYCYERGVPTLFGDQSLYILDWDETPPVVDKPLT